MGLNKGAGDGECKKGAEEGCGDGEEDVPWDGCESEACLDAFAGGVSESESESESESDALLERVRLPVCFYVTIHQHTSGLYCRPHIRVTHLSLLQVSPHKAGVRLRNKLVDLPSATLTDEEEWEVCAEHVVDINTRLVSELTRVERGLSGPCKRVETRCEDLTDRMGDVPRDNVPRFVLNPRLPYVLVGFVLAGLLLAFLGPSTEDCLGPELELDTLRWS